MPILLLIVLNKKCSKGLTQDNQVYFQPNFYKINVFK